MRISVRLQREIARLHFHDTTQSHRSLARSLNIAPGTVQSVRKRFLKFDISWQELQGLDDHAWQQRLGTRDRSIAQSKSKPDWAYVHEQMQRPNATQEVIWREWRESMPNGIGYSSFTDGYRKWVHSLNIVMRQVHRPGDRLFVDFAGQTVTIHLVDSASFEAQIFIGVLGFSNWTFVWAVENQKAAAFAECLVKCFESMGGVPKWVVPDNLKAAVLRRTRERIELNPTFRACLAHYGTAAMPARPRRPRDKGKAEVGVQIAQRWILFRLRDRVFFSLTELNEELVRLTIQLNAHPFKKLPGCRTERFEEGERQSLMPLPAEPYVAEDWKYCVRVGRDYHVEHMGCYYSVPSEAAGEQVDLRFTSNILEIFRQGRRIALHTISSKVAEVITLDEHRPVAHRRVLEGEPLALASWAKRAFPSTKAMMLYHLEQRSDITNGHRTAGRLRELARVHGEVRFEEVCSYALALNITALRSIESILQTSPDKRLESNRTIVHAAHENIRGSSYYGEAQ